MRAAGPVRQDYPLLSSPELDQVRKLMQLADVPLIQVRSETLDLTLRR
jgi:oxaloacetate decarboxylase alpha subunit